MRLLVIGLGYVGLANFLSFERYHDVYGLDLSKARIEALKDGKSPINEKGFNEAIKGPYEHVYSDYEEIRGLSFDALVLCLPTPSRKDGGCDLSYIEASLKALKEHEVTYKYALLRSTASLETYKEIEEIAGRKGFVISNPEFLAQGRAYEDEIHPDRVVVGTSSKEAEDFAKELYKPQIEEGIPFYFTDNVTAQLSKYASNAFLSLKVSFINEMSRVSEAYGGDIRVISKIVGADRRIGKWMLEAGLGYGGSCFPKDTLAILDEAKKKGVNLHITAANIETNIEQREQFLKAIEKSFPKEKTLVLLGLSFKKDTPDLRSSLSIFFANSLLEAGYHLVAFDSMEVVRKEFKQMYPSIKVSNTLDDALKGAGGIVILNNDPLWTTLIEEKLLKDLEGRYIYDGRNMLEKKDFPSFFYKGIGY